MEPRPFPLNYFCGSVQNFRLSRLLPLTKKFLWQPSLLMNPIRILFLPIQSKEFDPFCRTLLFHIPFSLLPSGNKYCILLLVYNLIFDADIGKSSAHHYFVISTTRTIRVKIRLVHSVFRQISTRSSVFSERPRRRNMISRYRIS